MQSQIGHKDVEHFSKEEERVYSIAQNAYMNALAHFYYPPLPEPEYIFDYTKTKGFYIDPYSWRITLNLANTPSINLDNEYDDYFFSLSLHEISHYVYCPYDNSTNFRLLAAAIEGGVNKNYAPMVVNIFSDLYIDSKNHNDFPIIMDWELLKNVESLLKEKEIESMSDLWKVLVHCYEIIWGLKILPKYSNQTRIKRAAKSVVGILNRNFDDEVSWEGKVKRIAKVLKQIMKESCSMKDQNQIMEDMSGKSKNKGKPNNGNPFLTPEDVEETFGDMFEIKNPSFIKSGGTGGNESQGPEQEEMIQGTAEQIAQDMNYQTFADVLTLYGHQDTLENMAIWYRSIAKGLLQIRYSEKKPGNALPVYPTTWRIGDSIEDLDILQTLLTSPLVIPNITTRKWVKKDGPGISIDKKPPDLMIVIDSSGSMDWQFNKKKVSGRYHISLIAAFAALHYAISHGSIVSAINFSQNVVKEDWTNDFNKIERLLLKYQGNGTYLPVDRMEKILLKAEKPTLVILISDLEISNWGPTKEVFLRIIDRKHKLVAFFIDGNPNSLENNPELNELELAGAKFYCINKMKDLVGLVISEVESNFSEKN